MKGARVQAKRTGSWYLGNIVAPPSENETCWIVQCDVDSPGTVYRAAQVVVWVEPGGGQVFPGNADYHYPDVRLGEYNVAEAMAIVGWNPTLIGFNLKFEEGSRVEFRYPHGTLAWARGRIMKLPLSGSGGNFHVRGNFNGPFVEVPAADIRYDGADTDEVWTVAFVRRGCGRVSRIPALPPSGCWTCLMPRAPLLPAGSPGLFDDGWSGDNKRCRIVNRTVGPEHTRASGSEFYVGWKRPGRGEGLADSLGLSLFKDVRASSVEQGVVGDCWFLSALAAVAVNPKFITRLFVQKELDYIGRYVVRLWSLLEGRWKAHVIDDRLPTLNDSPVGLTLANANISSEGELWPCLLEKAMAIHMGGYAAMDGGSACFALGTLLGCPCNKLAHARQCANGDWRVWKVQWSDDHGSDMEFYDGIRLPADEFLDLLCIRLLSGNLLCAATPSSASNPRNVGLSAGHAYSVLDIRRNVAGCGLDMVRLRNPCSDGLTSGYSGQWGPRSPRWFRYPEIAKALLSNVECYDQYDEPWASFWMTYLEMCQHFGTISMAARSAIGPDAVFSGDMDGLATNTGAPSVGARVHVVKEGVWFQGYIHALAEGGVDGIGPWEVQCDADPPGALTSAGEVLTWIEPGGTHYILEDPQEYQIQCEYHTLPAVMDLVLTVPDACGFNLKFDIGSRVECKCNGVWAKGRIVALPGEGHEGKFRVQGVCGVSRFEIITARIRYDMSDLETVWQTMILRRGTPLVSQMPALGEGHWTCMMPQRGALWTAPNQ